MVARLFDFNASSHKVKSCRLSHKCCLMSILRKRQLHSVESDPKEGMYSGPGGQTEGTLVLYIS